MVVLVWACVTIDCPVYAYAPGPLCPRCGAHGRPARPPRVRP